MSDPKQEASCGFLKKILARAFLVGLLGVAFLGVGICQTPGYKDKPDEWAPYDRGQYFEQLQTIVKTYRFDGSKITYHHFEETDVGIRPVELFRIPVARTQDCSEKDCYFFVLVAFDHREAPLLTRVNSSKPPCHICSIPIVRDSLDSSSRVMTPCFK